MSWTPQMLEKSATVTVSLNASSGYSADLTAPISAAQWGVINALLEAKEDLYLAAEEMLIAVKQCREALSRASAVLAAEGRVDEAALAEQAMTVCMQAEAQATPRDQVIETGDPS